MIIIGLSGKMGAGKDWMCDNTILPYYEMMDKKIHKISFAKKLKDYISDRHNINRTDLDGGNKPQHIRELLQKTGDFFRATDPCYFIKELDREIKSLNSIDVLIITDVRFKNEMDYVVENGGHIIRIISPFRTLCRSINEKSNTSHTSENDLNFLDLTDFEKNSKICKIYNDRYNYTSSDKIYNILNMLIYHRL